MKKIVLLFAAALGLVACGAPEKQAVVERNANTQNPIMPIAYCNSSAKGQEIYLTDYLPQVNHWDSLNFTTEPSYQVLDVDVEKGILTLIGDQTLSVLSVEDLTTGITYDIPIIAVSNYEAGLVTKSCTDSTITIGVLNEYEHLQFRIFWQNQQANEFVEYTQYGDEAIITIEQAWRNSTGRSFVRIFAMGDGKQLNDVLIPLENGEVVNDVKDLTRFDDQAQILYSLMIDRFENGNKDNDWKMNSPEVLDIVDYQGGDLAGITKKIEEGFFTELGVSTIWISPITQNPWDAWGMYPFPNGNKYDSTKTYTKFSGYHGYWPIFATAVDKRFGTEEELRTLLATAHANNINVVLDYVANHMHINSPTLQQHPTWHTDSILPDGRRNFELWDEARLTTWFDVHIPTLDLEREEVCGPMTDSALYWLENFDFDGFRHDACKHIPLNYWRELGKKMKQRFPDRHIWMIGETYGNTELIGSYVKSGMLNAQFDFNIYHTAIDVLGKPNQSLKRINETIMESLAAYGSHHTMGNISGNHDKCRFISLAGGAVSWDENDKAAGWTRNIGVTADGDTSKEAHAYKMAMLLEVINFTIPGVPCVYQGDEYGEAGANDPDNRHMAKFDGFNEQQAAFRVKVQELAKLRRENMALIYGEYLPIKTTDDTLHFKRIYMGQVVDVVISLTSESSISIDGNKVWSIQ
jgi:glycosidase